MNGRVLADTNVFIALFEGEPEIMDRVRQQTQISLCVPVLGELRYGAMASARVQENLARLDHFVRHLPLLICDRATAAVYSEVKQKLRAKGKPIPENDVWIAAIAVQHELTLVTRDKHFGQIDALSLDVW